MKLLLEKKEKNQRVKLRYETKMRLKFLSVKVQLYACRPETLDDGAS